MTDRSNCIHIASGIITSPNGAVEACTNCGGVRRDGEGWTHPGYAIGYERGKADGVAQLATAKAEGARIVAAADALIDATEAADVAAAERAYRKLNEALIQRTKREITVTSMTQAAEECPRCREGIDDAGGCFCTGEPDFDATYTTKEPTGTPIPDCKCGHMWAIHAVGGEECLDPGCECDAYTAPKEDETP